MSEDRQPALSDVEGPGLSNVEGPGLSEVEGPQPVGPGPSDDDATIAAPADTAAVETAAPKPRTSGALTALAVVAGAVLIVGAGAFALAPGGSTDRSDAAPKTPAVPESAPIEGLKIEPLVVKTVARPAWRARMRKEVAFPAAFDEAITPYFTGDFAAAAQNMQALAARFPKSPEPLVYAGVSHLFLGHPQEAVDSLKAAAPLTQEVFAQDIRWYLALAYRAQGRFDASMLELRLLCATGAEYGPRACFAVREIESRYRAAREAAVR